MTLAAGLDPGIERYVHLLQAADVETFESCQGGEGHSYAEPTVSFYGTPAAGWHAVAVCKDAGLPVLNLHRTWDFDDGEPSGPYWRLVFRADPRPPITVQLDGAQIARALRRPA